MNDTHLQKAKFQVFDDFEKGTFKSSEELTVLFNPSQYSISGGASYKTAKSSSGTTDAGLKEEKNFDGTKAQTLSLELFFDTSARSFLNKSREKASDVAQLVKKFVKLTHVSGENHNPPVIKFSWGSLGFCGRITSLKTTYTMFDRDGKPVRAKMDLQIEEERKSSNKYIEPFESPDRTKARRITQDSSVWSIARTEYGSPSMWRHICEANNIENPLDIPVGTVLKVPALE